MCVFVRQVTKNHSDIIKLYLCYMTLISQSPLHEAEVSVFLHDSCVRSKANIIFSMFVNPQILLIDPGDDNIDCQCSCYSKSFRCF